MHDHDDLQVFRQWMILRTLGARRHGMSVRELAEERGVDRQTIRRDLKLLQNLGFPLVESEFVTKSASRLTPDYLGGAAAHHGRRRDVGGGAQRCIQRGGAPPVRSWRFA